MNHTSNRYRDYNGREHRGPQGIVLSGVVRNKDVCTPNNADMRLCADHTTKEQPTMSARVNVNTPAAAPAMTSTHATEKQPAMSVRVNVNTPIAAPVTASAYIEKYCTSDIYVCKVKEQAGQYSYNYKTEGLVNTSAMAFALAKHGRAASYDRIASWGIVA